jgi:hypothetical protein
VCVSVRVFIYLCVCVYVIVFVCVCELLSFMHSGDSLLFQKDTAPFSTKNADHDTYSESCSNRFHGAWWYTQCHRSNLNGQYYQEGENPTYASGIVWKAWTGYYQSLKSATMKMRSETFQGQQYHEHIILKFRM